MKVTFDSEGEKIVSHPFSNGLSPKTIHDVRSTFKCNRNLLEKKKRILKKETNR